MIEDIVWYEEIPVYDFMAFDLNFYVLFIQELPEPSLITMDYFNLRLFSLNMFLLGFGWACWVALLFCLFEDSFLESFATQLALRGILLVGIQTHIENIHINWRRRVGLGRRFGLNRVWLSWWPLNTAEYFVEFEWVCFWRCFCCCACPPLRKCRRTVVFWMPCTEGCTE